MLFSSPLAMMVGSGMVLTLPSERCLACVTLSQRRFSFHVPLTLTPSDSGRRLEKLSSQDPKVCMIVIETESELDLLLVTITTHWNVFHMTTSTFTSCYYSATLQ